MKPIKLTMFLINILIIVITYQIIFVKSDGSYTIRNKIHFPYSSVEGPFMGIFVALAMPLDLPDYAVSFSYSFEGNYVLPENETEYQYPPLVSKRSWDRKFFYDIFEFKLKSHGFPGRACLLRTICEASLYSTQHTGILGDVLHIILTPSTSNNTGLKSDYTAAEVYGSKKKDCKKYNKCSISILDLISSVGKYFDTIMPK